MNRATVATAARAEYEYKKYKTVIRACLNSAAEDFFKVGYFLRQIKERELYTEDGYKDIWEKAILSTILKERRADKR